MVAPGSCHHPAVPDVSPSEPGFATAFLICWAEGSHMRGLDSSVGKPRGKSRGKAHEGKHRYTGARTSAAAV